MIRQTLLTFLRATTILLAAHIGCAAAAEAERNAGPNGLVWQDAKDGGHALVWKAKSGRRVVVNDPRITVTDPQTREKRSLKLGPAVRKPQKREDGLEYRFSLADTNDKRHSITGSVRLELSVSDKADEDVLLCHADVRLDRPAALDVTVECAYELPGSCPSDVSMPERSGRVAMQSLRPGVAEGGRFELGAGTAGAGRDLGLPVVDFCWSNAEGDHKPLRLAVAADPYCGCAISGEARPEGTPPLTQVSISTTYQGSVVPLTGEKRTMSLEFHRRGADGSFRSFYRTIPEIKPGPAWTQSVQLVCYDYLSEHGDGWFKDLQTLADRIPPEHRGRVAACLHGWYDYYQNNAYDHRQKKLLKEWTAFPNTYKVPMSLADMHKRLKFAKGLGFHALLYFSDGVNCDPGAPNFHPEYVLKDKAGKVLAGWKGPDTLKQSVAMDPGVPGVGDWYRGYLAALLAEYADDLDGFVWDETFVIPTNRVSYTQSTPGYADRAMMRLVSELTQMVQQCHARNPNLVFLASDNGRTNYALAAHGTYQDSSCNPNAWGPSMFANYRNCLWSCNWYPVKGQRKNEIAAERFGLPQGVSNGYGDNRGPHNMPPELLDAVLRRFTKNVESGRQRARTLSDVKPPAAASSSTKK
jgi:hypothetical protein